MNLVTPDYTESAVFSSSPSHPGREANKTIVRVDIVKRQRIINGAAKEVVKGLCYEV